MIHIFHFSNFGILLTWIFETTTRISMSEISDFHVCVWSCVYALQPCPLSYFPQFHTRLGYPFYSFDFQNFQKNSNVIVEHRKPRTHSPPQVDDPLIVWLSPSGLYWLFVSQCQTHRGVTWGLDTCWKSEFWSLQNIGNAQRTHWYDGELIQ